MATKTKTKTEGKAPAKTRATKTETAVVLVFASVLADALMGKFGPAVTRFYVNAHKYHAKTDYIGITTRKPSPGAIPEDLDEKGFKFPTKEAGQAQHVRNKFNAVKDGGPMFENAEGWQREFYRLAILETRAARA